MGKPCVRAVRQEERQVPKETHLRDESCKTTNRIHDGRTRRVVARERRPQPNPIQKKGEEEKEQSEKRDDLREEPDLLLNRRQLELLFAGHGHQTTHHRAVSGSKRNSSAGTLSNERRIQGEVASLESIIRRCGQDTGDHIAILL